MHTRRLIFDKAPGRRIALCAVALMAGVITVLPTPPVSASVSTPAPVFGRPR
jgi:hypothetical protein